jgi:hypothetical protein
MTAEQKQAETERRRRNKRARERRAQHRANAGSTILAGIAPRRGMYLVNHARRRVYGQILGTTTRGEVRWWANMFRCEVSTSGELLYDAGCCYEAEAPDGYDELK